MKPFHTFSVLCALLVFSPASFAEKANNMFSADELKSIRGVSQAILQTRGSQRRAVIKETQPLRDEIKTINTELALAYSELNTSVFEIDTSVNSIEKKPDSGQTLWQKATKRLGWSENNRQKSTKNSLVYREKFNHRLGRVKALANRQKSKIDERMPARWKIWQSPEEKDVRMKRVFSRLEAELELLESDDVSLKEKRQKMKALMAKWNPKKEFKKDTDPQPTISSITKHIRK